VEDEMEVIFEVQMKHIDKNAIEDRIETLDVMIETIEKELVSMASMDPVHLKEEDCDLSETIVFKINEMMEGYREFVEERNLLFRLQSEMKYFPESVKWSE
jgi:hypothetical protein